MLSTVLAVAFSLIVTAKTPVTENNLLFIEVIVLRPFRLNIVFLRILKSTSVSISLPVNPALKLFMLIMPLARLINSVNAPEGTGISPIVSAKYKSRQ